MNQLFLDYNTKSTKICFYTNTLEHNKQDIISHKQKNNNVIVFTIQGKQNIEEYKIGIDFMNSHVTHIQLDGKDKINIYLAHPKIEHVFMPLLFDIQGEKIFEPFQISLDILTRLYTVLTTNYKINSNFYRNRYHIIPKYQILNEPINDRIEYIVDKNNFLYPVFFETPIPNLLILKEQHFQPHSFVKTLEYIQSIQDFHILHVIVDHTLNFMHGIEIQITNKHKLLYFKNNSCSEIKNHGKT